MEFHWHQLSFLSDNFQKFEILKKKIILDFIKVLTRGKRVETNVFALMLYLLRNNYLFRQYHRINGNYLKNNNKKVTAIKYEFWYISGLFSVFWECFQCFWEFWVFWVFFVCFRGTHGTPGTHGTHGTPGTRGTHEPTGPMGSTPPTGTNPRTNPRAPRDLGHSEKKNVLKEKEYIIKKQNK